MSKAPLSRRERETLEVLFRLRQATVSEVLSELDDPPGYDGVRTTLRSLERKGYVGHHQEGPRYLYSPVEPVESARVGAMRQLVTTFFQGSAEEAALALLEMGDTELSDEELEKLRDLLSSPEDDA